MGLLAQRLMLAWCQIKKLQRQAKELPSLRTCLIGPIFEGWASALTLSRVDPRNNQNWVGGGGGGGGGD